MRNFDDERCVVKTGKGKLPMICRFLKPEETEEEAKKWSEEKKKKEMATCLEYHEKYPRMLSDGTEYWMIQYEIEANIEYAVIDFKDFDKMEANVTMQRFYLERENQLYLMQLDDDFHRMFFEICNKMQCYCLSKEFGIHFDRVRFASLENLRDNKTVQDHEDIVKLLRRKDVKKAKDVLRVHLSRFQTDKAKIQAAHENYFK